FQKIVAFGFKEPLVARHLRWVEGPAKGAPSELPDEFRGTSAAGRTRDQLMRIAAAEGAPRQALGSSSVSFREQRRDALPIGLVGVAVHEIFARETVGGPGLV